MFDRNNVADVLVGGTYVGEEGKETAEERNKDTQIRSVKEGAASDSETENFRL